MFRIACAVILIPAVVWGQSQNATVSVQGPESTERVALSAGVPKCRQYATYTELRQGTSEKMAISVSLPGFVTSPRKIVTGIAPLELQMDKVEGFTVTEVHYPKTYKQKVGFRPDPVAVALGGLITFKVHAARDLGLGKQTLTGRLKFQPLTASGVAYPQEIEIRISVTVVPHNAKVKHGKRFPSEGLNKPRIALLIVLSPVLLALLIPAGIVCGIASLTKHVCAD